MQQKLFIGFEISHELKQLLPKETALTITPYQKKEYIGFYIESATPLLKEVKEISSKVSHLLQKACPPIRVDRLPLYVFAQWFLG